MTTLTTKLGGFMSDFPLSLPEGSVRALISLAFTVTTCYLWATAQVVPESLLIINTGVVSYYFASRGTAAPTTQNVSAETVDAPFIPGENGSG